MKSSASTFTRGHYMALLAALLGWMFDGFEMGLFPLIGQPALKELLGQTSSALAMNAVELDAMKNQWFAVIMAMFLVGAATGGVLFGWIGDRLGRVRALSLSILTYAIFTGLCGFATEAWHIAVLRFIASLGMGGEWSLGVALVIEIWPDNSRALLAGLIGAAANVGFFMVAVISLTLNNLTGGVESALLAVQLPEATVATLTSNSMWRLLMIVGAAPALLVFLIRLFVPESEKWHAEQKRGATSYWATIDLLGVLVGCIGAVGVIAVWSPLVAGLPLLTVLRVIVTPVGLALAMFGYMYPVRRYLSRASLAGSLRGMDSPTVLRRMIFGAALTGVALLGTWGTVQWIPKWVTEMTTAVGSAPGHEKDYAQMASATGAIVGSILAALVGGWIGRRPTYFLLCLASVASALWLFLGNDAFGAKFLGSVFLIGSTTAAFYGFFPLYLPELFPTSVRSTAQGFAFNFGRIIAAVGSLQTATMQAFFDGDFSKAGSVMSLIYLIGAIIIWFGPETKNRPLPE